MSTTTDSFMKSESSVRVYLTKYRQVVQNYIQKHLYSSALFWADKVASLSKEYIEDVYWLAQCLFLTQQYHRAAHCILSRKLDKKHAMFRYLAAQSHYKAKEYQEALDILDGCRHNNQIIKITNEVDEKRETLISDEVYNFPSGTDVECSINLLRGYLYEALDNRCLAGECFKEALKLDVDCYEAFEALIKHQMLTSQEERDLLDNLPFEMQEFEDVDAESCLVKSLYENKLKRYDKPSMLTIPSVLIPLSDNLDLSVSSAERHYYNSHYQECFKITSSVLNSDPFHQECLPLHIACLVELKKQNDLFYLAHKLVDLYPENALSWFAVGCYYLLINKMECARRYLSKATTLDCVFGPAWLAYGHSFAIESEHDQAMAAYFKASQLMRGCHLPLLYIGLEYGLIHNSKLAERFFHQALVIAPEDPCVLHEMGVIAFQNEDWVTAEKYLKQAADIISKVRSSAMPERWEPVLNNLGHTYRKMRRYDDALDYHLKALLLCPRNASTLSAIGYVYSLKGMTYEAVDYFHKALSFRRDDMFSMTVLGQEIERLMGQMSPCEGLTDELPIYESFSDVSISKSQFDESTQNLPPEQFNSNLSIEVDMDGNN